MPPPHVAPVADSELDPRALFFVSYEGLVNCASYQQSGLLTHLGWQYAAWYTETRHAVVARRRLPDGAWERTVLPHQLHADDSHNTISLGVSAVDGRLHVAMDTHDNPVFYTCSPPGAVTDPGRYPLRFGPVERTVGGVDLGGISYPRFLATPEGWLQLSYRTGRSGNGTQELAELTGRGWSALGRWSSATGGYRNGNGSSVRRNLYLHGLRYGPGGRLHAAFTWREDDASVLSAKGGLANHDTGYVYSDDRGRSWRGEGGKLVAVTGADLLVAVDSPGLVVDPLGVDHALINQECLALDSAGQPHVVLSHTPGGVTDYVADRRAYGRVFHLYRDGDGRWHKAEVPVPLDAFGRSQLVFDAADNAYLVLPYGRVVTASAAQRWTDWTPRFDGAGLDAFGEVLVDGARLTAGRGILSVLYQRRSTGREPSAVRVADFAVDAG
ncbi:MAG TPA: BNR repeat-containing protein [Rugosimonospora sp.]|nr:BNR repeat-containing protein [Rugosimonospora sp.]